MASSVLEKFLILFEINSDEAKKGADNAKKSVKDLNDSLKETENSSSKLEKAFNGLLKNASKFLIGALAGGAISSAIKSAYEYANEIGRVSDSLGVSVETLSAWGQAVQTYGGSAEAFQSTLQKMNASLMQFGRTGSSDVLPFFQQLGIRLVNSQGQVKSFIGLLPELADVFSRVSKAESFSLGKQLGLDPGTILLLQKGRREVEETIRRQKEFNVVTKQDAEIAQKFNVQLQNTSQIFRAIFTRIASFILPGFTQFLKIVEKVTAYLSLHKDAVIGAVIGIGLALTAYLLPALIRLAPMVWAAFSPFLVITGIIAALALVFEDVNAYLKGNASLLGVLIEKYPAFGKVVSVVGAIIKATWNSLKLFFDFLLYVVDRLFWSLDKIGKAFSKIGAAYEKIKGFLGGKKSEVSYIEQGKQTLEFAGMSPLTARSATSLMAGGRFSNRNTSVQTGNINIQTQATDADGIAQSIGQSLQDQMRQAVSNFDDGVAI